MDCFTLENLSFTYPNQEKAALNNINLSIKKGVFFLICGHSGCGKSTLLRNLKCLPALHGERTGEVLFFSTPIEAVPERTQAEKIGFVTQSAENQIVTDKVWHELAFGLESLGEDTAVIRKRVAEMAAFFGIEQWFHKNISELSGGQKQLLALASVMTLQPDALILDEPTAQLDPLAANEFLTALGRINREFGTTVIISEHRLEEAFTLASEVLVMENGSALVCGTPSEVALKLKACSHGMFSAMPTPMRVWAGIENDLECPITVREGVGFIEKLAQEKHLKPTAVRERIISEEIVLSAENVWFRYERDLPDVLKDFSVKLYKGELFALMGGNGAGKSTALRVLAGIKPAYRGEVTKKGKTALLPQDPKTLFIKKTIGEELYSAFDGMRLKAEEKKSRVIEVAELCGIVELLNRHPYDASGGELQRAGLARILLTEPEIILLDEPTKALDVEFKTELATLLKRLTKGGVSIFMVSHDVNFCAEYADRCGLIFDGEIVACATPEEFFSGNSFYTTSANRMARSVLPRAVTAGDIISAFGGHTDEVVADTVEYKKTPLAEKKQETQARGISAFKKLAALACGAVATVIFGYVISQTDLSRLVNSGGISGDVKTQLLLYGALIASLFGLFALLKGGKKKDKIRQTAVEKGRFSHRTVFSAGIILLLIPLTVLFGMFCLDNKSYGIISLLVVLECMLPFFLFFEGRRPQPRELVTVAVLCALGVASRIAFFMLPQFKPVAALAIIAGVAFGGETGFLVGSITMLVSNMMFGNGPWTPWQMLCMGLLGFFAGILYRKDILRAGRISLAIYGAIGCVVIYGGIINPTSLLLWSPEGLTLEVVLAAYISGFPMDLIHALSTAFFLYVLSEAMLEKLERLKTKYGLAE